MEVSSKLLLPHRTLGEESGSSLHFLPWLHGWKEENPLVIILRWVEPQGCHSQGSAGSGSSPSSCMRHQWHSTVKPRQLPPGVSALTPCSESWAKQKGFSTIVYFETKWRWRTGKHFLALIISLIERIMQLHADWFKIRACVPYKRIVPSIWTIWLDILENCSLEKPAGISCVPAQANASCK